MFNYIDYDNWDRKDIFVFLRDVLFSVTVDCDMTNIIRASKEKGYRMYPIVNYCVAKVINDNECYRYAMQEGRVGYYDRIDVLYTLPRVTTSRLFTHKVTQYNSDFFSFYQTFEQDRLLAEQCDRLHYDSPLPENVVCTSIMPTLRFSALAFNYLEKDGTSFVPFVTWGKYCQENGRLIMPVCAEFHHETNDGYHAELFFELLQKCFDELAVVIQSKG